MLCLVAIIALPVLGLAGDRAGGKTNNIDKQIMKLRAQKDKLGKAMAGLDKKIAESSAANKTDQVAKMNSRKEAIAKAPALIDGIIALLEQKKTAPKEQLEGLNKQIKEKTAELRATLKPDKK